MKRLIILPIVFVLLFSTAAMAQFEIGASYEIRNEVPENGFGIRLQKGILDKVPLADLGLRLHFSYFSDENQVNSDGNVSFSQDFSNYDFGVAAYGGVSLGLMQPYIGLGLGSETVDLTIKDFQGSGSEPEEGRETNMYWNTFIGAKVTVIPILKPFVEYRYSNKELGEPTLADAQNGRIMFGLYLSF